MHSFEVQPPDSIRHEVEHSPTAKLVAEAVAYLKEEREDVDDMALARMFIERGYSEEFAYWIVREAEVQHAPGELPTPDQAKVF